MRRSAPSMGWRRPGLPALLAVEGYAARADQSWSLTDCASFLVMEE